MGNLLILVLVFAVIYFIVVLIGMVESRNEQIEGMQKYEDTLLEELQAKTKECDEKDSTIADIKRENKDLKNADARNTGLYYKIVDLSNENEWLKEEIKRMKK